jgi:hypothetical protein
MKCQTCPGDRETSGVRICTGCERWLWEALADLESMHAALLTSTALQPVAVHAEVDLTTPRVKNALPSRSPKPQSKSPARDEAIVLTDRRSKDARGNPVSIPGVLRDWSGRLEEAGLGRPVFSVLGWSDHARTHWTTSVQQSWIVVVVRNVKLVHKRAAGLLSELEPEPSPVGQCTKDTCTGKLWLEGPVVVCGECGDHADGFDLIRDHRPPDQPESPMMTTAEIAVHFGARPGTVRVWIHRSGAERDPEGKVDVRVITEFLQDRPSVGVA